MEGGGDDRILRESPSSLLPVSLLSLFRATLPARGGSAGAAAVTPGAWAAVWKEAFGKRQLNERGVKECE